MPHRQSHDLPNEPVQPATRKAFSNPLGRRRKERLETNFPDKETVIIREESWHAGSRPAPGSELAKLPRLRCNSNHLAA